MTLFKRLRIGIFAASAFVFCPQISQADSLTSQDVLNWKAESQDFYIWSSVTMAGVVASQNRREAAQCIDGWYSGNDQTRKVRNRFVLETMSKYPNHNPQAIIFAIIRKQCGTLF